MEYSGTDLDIVVKAWYPGTVLVPVVFVALFFLKKYAAALTLLYFCDFRLYRLLSSSFYRGSSTSTVPVMYQVVYRYLYCTRAHSTVPGTNIYVLHQTPGRRPQYSKKSSRDYRGMLNR